MQYLLDTNICIAAMRNHPLVVRRMAAQSPGDCAISTITGYELYTGVAKCANPARERSKVDLLLATLVMDNMGEFARVSGLSVENWKIAPQP